MSAHEQRRKKKKQVSLPSHHTSLLSLLYSIVFTIMYAWSLYVVVVGFLHPPLPIFLLSFYFF
jgi:uncharacterized membrane protein YbhN (UPF0104 family)